MRRTASLWLPSVVVFNLKHFGLFKMLAILSSSKIFRPEKSNKIAYHFEIDYRQSKDFETMAQNQYVRVLIFCSKGRKVSDLTLGSNSLLLG